MRLFWSESLRTGNREIDLQHQELIEIINELEEFLAGRAANPGCDLSQPLDHLISRLANYVTFHFLTEESMFSSKALPAAHVEQHTREHQDFLKRFGSFQAQSPDNRIQQADALFLYLKQWLANHILKTDMELVSLYRGKARKFGQ